MRLDTGQHTRFVSQTAGAVADPATTGATRQSPAPAALPLKRHRLAVNKQPTSREKVEHENGNSSHPPEVPFEVFGLDRSRRRAGTVMGLAGLGLELLAVAEFAAQSRAAVPGVGGCRTGTPTG